MVAIGVLLIGSFIVGWIVGLAQAKSTYGQVAEKYADLQKLYTATSRANERLEREKALAPYGGSQDEELRRWSLEKHFPPGEKERTG